MAIMNQKNIKINILTKKNIKNDINFHALSNKLNPINFKPYKIVICIIFSYFIKRTYMDIK